jgi:FtsP/CotA-like multicopper oxidase with cupredoxin domain
MLAATVGERSAGYPLRLRRRRPGRWMTHCHNLYHAPQGGMMATLSYQT